MSLKLYKIVYEGEDYLDTHEVFIKSDGGCKCVVQLLLNLLGMTRLEIVKCYPDDLTFKDGIRSFLVVLSNDKVIKVECVADIIE